MSSNQQTAGGGELSNQSVAEKIPQPQPAIDEPRPAQPRVPPMIRSTGGEVGPGGIGGAGARARYDMESLIESHFGGATGSGSLPSGYRPLSSLTSGASSTTNTDAEIKFTLSLYDGLTSLPRKEFVKKLNTIAQFVETADDPALHLMQLEDLCNQYLAPPDPNSAVNPAPTLVTAAGTEIPTIPSLIQSNVEFTTYFLDTALPTIVRNLLTRTYTCLSIVSTSAVDESEAVIARVFDFFHIVMQVIVKHLKEPTKPVVMLLPAPAPTTPAATGAATSAAPSTAAPSPAFITQTVNPLFTDSICNGLIATLTRLLDHEREFFKFYDRPGLGKDDDTLGFSDDDEPPFVEVTDFKMITFTPQALQGLTKEEFMVKSGLTEEQVLQKHNAQQKARQLRREKERAAKIEARIELAKKIEAMKPKKQYSLVAPGRPSHGWLQKNIQYFGEIGGFDLIVERTCSGVNTNLDTRILVAERKGVNSSGHLRPGFYKKEYKRRQDYAKLCQARGEQYQMEPTTVPKGSFPSLTPYLMQKSFLDPATSPPAFLPIPLHRWKVVLEPIKVVWNNLDKAYFQEIGPKIKDTLLIRLLHIRPDESRLCDKAYLTHVLEEYVWKIIKRLSELFHGSNQQIEWPILDEASELAWKADKKILKEIEALAEAKAKQELPPPPPPADDEEPVPPAEEKKEPEAPIVVPPIPPPPTLYEINLDADELMESITIYLSYQLFCSPLLEKRINGLMDINRFIELTINRHRRENPPPGQVCVAKPYTAWMNKEVLSAYLLQIRIMDDLFGEFDEVENKLIDHDKSIHPQLIQRCDEIIKYLGQMELLSPTHLRQVWAASIGKHETVVQAIYRLLGTCYRSYKLEHIQLILEEFIPSIPIHEWGEHTLRLVVSLLDGGYSAEEESIIIEHGIGILWKMMTLPHGNDYDETQMNLAPTIRFEPTNAPPAFPPTPITPTTNISFYLKQLCAYQIHHLLMRNMMEPLRRRYIYLMLALLRSPRLPVAARGMLLWLLPNLLSCYTNQRPQPQDQQRWQFLGNLLDKERFYQLLLDELTRFTATAHATADRLREAFAKRHTRRKLPDATLLVLGEPNPSANASSSALSVTKDGPNTAYLGIAISDLDASIQLPQGMDSSADLLLALKAVHESDGTHPIAAAALASTSSNLTMTRSNSSAAHSSVCPYSESFSYEMEVLLRLELLRFVISNSFVPLTSKHIDSLWTGCMSQSVSQEARTQFYLWLRSVHHPKPAQKSVVIEVAEAQNLLEQQQAGSGKYVGSFLDTTRHVSSFSAEATEHLFSVHLCNPSLDHITQMDEAAFLAWRHYFLVINESAKLIRLHAPLAGPFATPVVNGQPATIKFYLIPSSSPLVGLEYLWSLCLNVQSPRVVHLAVDLLIQAHACDSSSHADSGLVGPPVPEDHDWVHSMREKYVARCMEFMRESGASNNEKSTSGSTPANSTRLLRCLSLLQAFMQACATAEGEDIGNEKHADGGDATSSSAPGVSFTIQVEIGSFLPSSTELLRLTCLNDITIRQVKEQIGALLSIPPAKMSLNTTNGTPRELLNYETLTSKSLEIEAPLMLGQPTNRSNIQHRENDHAMEESESVGGDEDDAALNLARTFTPATNEPPVLHHSTSAMATTHEHRNPTSLLSNHQEYFDLLFSLLSQSSTAASAQDREISQGVWKLITSLPTNQRLLDEMKSLSSITRTSTATPNPDSPVAKNPWVQLLDPNSPFKLLYSLRIISKLAAPHIPHIASSTNPKGGASSSSSAPPPSLVSTKQFLIAMEWRNKFMKLGGVQYLYQILLQLLEQRSAAHTKVISSTNSASLVEWDESRNSCLLLLLKLFNFFLLSAQVHSNESIINLFAEVLPELQQRMFTDLGQHHQAQYHAFLRQLSALPLATQLLNGINFNQLTKESLKLLGDCAKSSAKAWKLAQATAGTHSRNGSLSTTGGLKSATISPAHSRPGSTVNLVDHATAEATTSDESLIKLAIILLSACVLHQPSSPLPANEPTPLTLLTSSASSTMYSTMLFLCPSHVSYELSEGLLNLARHLAFRAQPETNDPSRDIEPFTLHRFLIEEILLKYLPTLVASSKYTAVAFDYFQLFDPLLKELLTREFHPENLTKLMPNFDWTAFFLQLVGYLRTRPIHETKAAAPNTDKCDFTPAARSSAPSSNTKLNDTSADEVLIGLMNLISTLITANPSFKDLIAERPRPHSLELDELLNELAVSGNQPLTKSDSTSPSTTAHNNVAAGLVDEIFHYLFDLPTLHTAHLAIQAPKCKRRNTRIAAFNLLLSMVDEHPTNFYTLSSLLYQQNVENNSVNSTYDWEYSPEDYTKSSTGYVGLTNLSSTCYLNSMMQQLFMIPAFRRKVLSINIPNLATTNTNNSGPAGGNTRSGSPTSDPKNNTNSAAASVALSNLTVDPTEHLLYQIQFMFGFLESSSKKAYNPVNFCKAFKDYEGKSIDIRIQQDVDEFFNVFCDRLEGSLKMNHAAQTESTHGLLTQPGHSSDLDLVKNIFGGELEHQLLCQDCPHKSYRAEPFYVLQLNVKNKTSIGASLENFVGGEMLEGDNAYMCHACTPPKKVKTFKRVCLKNLPQILVLNLKRFEFNYDSMKKVKLNDLVTFPTEPSGLNLEPFTAEGLAKKEAAKANPSQPPKDTSNEETKESKESDDTPSAAPTLQHTSSLTGVTGAAAGSAPSTYTLVGVLLHSGGSESGHYTSLVKERSSNSANGGRWLEFNDSNVREFDPSQLANECFGGTQTVNIWDTKLRRKVMKEVEKTRSAYLLIYERDPPIAPMKTGETPLNSPVRGRSLASAMNGEDSNVDPTSSPSPSGFISPTGGQVRSKTPTDTSRKSPRKSPMKRSVVAGAESPPPISIGRSHSTGGSQKFSKKLEFGAGEEPAEELEANESSYPPPTYSPSFSRQTSLLTSQEQKVPELNLNTGACPSPHRPSTSSGSIGSMPPQIYETIWNENLAFLKNSQLFQIDYFKFLVAFLRLAPDSYDDEDGDGGEEIDPSQPRTRRYIRGLPSVLGCEDEIRHIQLAAIFLTDVLSHAKYITNPPSYERDRDRSEDEALKNATSYQKSMRIIGGRTGHAQRYRMQIDSTTAPHGLLAVYKDILFEFFSNHVPAACWFINDLLTGPHHSRLRYFLFECSSEYMRDYLSDIFSSVLGVLVSHERPIYQQYETTEIKVPIATAVGSNQPSGGFTTQVTHTPVAFTLQFINRLMSMWKDLPIHWKSLSPYFSILNSFAALGYNERIYLINFHNIIVLIIDLILGPQSRLALNEKYKRPIMGDADTAPNFYNAYLLLTTAVRSSIFGDGGFILSEADFRAQMSPLLLTIRDGNLPLPEEEESHETPQPSTATTIAPSESSGSPDELPADDGVSSPSSRQGSGSSISTVSVSTTTPPSVFVSYLPGAKGMTVQYILDHIHRFTQDEQDFLISDISFLRKMIKEGVNSDATKSIIAHMIWNHERNDIRIASLILKLIEEANWNQLEPMFFLFPHLLSLTDQLQVGRLERYLNPKSGLIGKASVHRVQYPMFTTHTIKFIFLNLAKMDGHPIKTYLVQHRDSLYWCLSFIQIQQEQKLRTRSLLDEVDSPKSKQPMFELILTAMRDFFGSEYLAVRAEQDRQEALAAQAAHEARVEAQREAMKANLASRPPAGQFRVGSVGQIAAAGQGGTQAGDVDIYNQPGVGGGRHMVMRRPDPRMQEGGGGRGGQYSDDDDDQDDPDSHEFNVDSDDDRHLGNDDYDDVDEPNDVDEDAPHNQLANQAYESEVSTIQQILRGPNGQKTLVDNAHVFRYQHRQISEARVALERAGLATSQQGVQPQSLQNQFQGIRIQGIKSIQPSQVSGGVQPKVTGPDGSEDGSDHGDAPGDSADHPIDIGPDDETDVDTNDVDDLDGDDLDDDPIPHGGGHGSMMGFTPGIQPPLIDEPYLDDDLEDALEQVRQFQLKEQAAKNAEAGGLK